MKTERLQRIQRVMRVQKVVEALENQEAEAVLQAAPPSPPAPQELAPCAAAALVVCVELAAAAVSLPAPNVPAAAGAEVHVDEIPPAVSPPAYPSKDRVRRGREAYDIQRGGAEKIAEKADPSRRPAQPTLRQLKAARYWYVPIFDLPG